MKRTLIILSGAILIASSCSKTPIKTATPPSGGSTAFTTMFPHIDTATLWNMFDTKHTGSTAKITLTGDMVITGYSTVLESYAGGTYKIQLSDSTSGQFNLLRSGPDTVISRDCYIWIDTTGYKGRRFYHLFIDGGNLPASAIVRGAFVDSI